MKVFTPVVMAAAAFVPGILADTISLITSVTKFPGHAICPTATATVTSRRPMICDIVCEVPASTCRPGQPTQNPKPTGTVTSDCTEILYTGGLCACPTCVLPTPTSN